MGAVIIYADERGKAAFKYLRLVTLGRFELAVTWPTRKPGPTIAERPSDEELLRPL